MSKGMTLAELLSLPLMINVSTAARALGLSRSTGYELARRGEFPCRVLHVGSSYRVPAAEPATRPGRTRQDPQDR
jgi:excisionase family DNA binding protein